MALAPEVKYSVLTENTLKSLWDKLEGIYASKLLINRLCLKMDLYSLKIEEGMSFHNHLNEFNRLVSQLLAISVGELKNEEKALILLSSLPKSYGPIVQTVLVGRSTLKLDDVTTLLRENKRFIRAENSSPRESILAVEGFDRRKTQKKIDGSKGRSKSRDRDYSDIECYYYGKK